MNLRKVLLFLIFILTISSKAFANQWFNAGQELGHWEKVNCSTGLTCSVVAGKLTIVTSSTINSFTIGIADEVDTKLVFDGNAQDFYLGLDDSADDLIIGLGSSVGVTPIISMTDTGVTTDTGSTDGDFTVYGAGVSASDAYVRMVGDAGADASDRWQFFNDSSAATLYIQSDPSVAGTYVTVMSITSTGDVVLNGTTPFFTIGDAGEEDAGIGFDGNAQNYHMSLDDSTDNLVLGLGFAAGTTDAIRIDANQDVTFVQGVLGLGTDELVGFLQNTVTSTTTTLTAAQCGSTIVNDSTDVMTLPEASTVIGCRYTFVINNASNFDINPNDGTDIILPFTLYESTTISPSAGDAIRAEVAGEGIVIEAVSANNWAVVGTPSGTWTDVN